jgi:tripartite-type tricarboxylate transporter receptor subunit TctC
MKRRGFLQTGAAASLLALPGVRALAQGAYPSRAITSVGSFGAGTGADIALRFYSEKLQNLAGKPVVVEPRVGVGGTIAAASVARAAPDGHTIYLAPSSTVIAAAPHLYRSLAYDPAKDFAHVAAVYKAAFCVVVPRSSPVQTMADLTEHLRKLGPKGSYGTATLPGKITGELYKQQFGLSTVEVPYKTGVTALNDLVSGLFDFYVTDTGTAKSQLSGGRLRALMVTSRGRMESLPDIPGAGDAGVKLDLIAYSGLHVPAQTPRPIIEQLAAWIGPIAASEEARKMLSNLGYDPWLGDAKVVIDMLERETRAWAEYARIAKIEPQ